ncbi:hypothetical protein DD549_14335 [Shewanella algae]|uniref:hypothetical protein n=1 Tax=Shewanella algae TaxID=38313 RepID=UPI000D646097|nr:hypothetical protein [Shewanella algae]PWF91268.1 hypothetical protein DD549_14335 [Shewanella algae]
MYDFDNDDNNPYEPTGGFITFEELEQDRQEFMARLRRSQEIDDQVSVELKQMHKVIDDLEQAVLAVDPAYDRRHLQVVLGQFAQLIKRGIKVRAGSDPDGDAYRPNLFNKNDDFDVDTFTNENE